MEPVVRKIVYSSKHLGHFAIGRKDGHLLQRGEFIAVQQGNDWYAGIVVQNETGCYIDTIPLLEGMSIKLL